MNAAIPVRFNSNAVARYETIMRQLCASWPQPILVNPAPLGIETFRCRFRDAMRGVLEYNQGSEELLGLLRKLSEPVVLSESHGSLKIGPRSALKLKPQNAPQAGAIISGIATLADNTAAVVGPDRAVIQAIALLTSHGILAGARVEGVTEEFIWASFPEDYEGGVVQNEDGTFSIY